MKFYYIDRDFYGDEAIINIDQIRYIKKSAQSAEVKFDNDRCLSIRKDDYEKLKSLLLEENKQELI